MTKTKQNDLNDLFDSFKQDEAFDQAEVAAAPKSSRARPVAKKDDSKARELVRAFKEQPVEVDLETMAGRFTDAQAAVKYMLAGNATVTVKSTKTGNRFTFKLQVKDDATPGPKGLPVFVKLLVGPDNYSNYKYLGTIFTVQGVYWHGVKSTIGKDAPGAVAFEWTWKQLTRGNMPAQLELWHEGSCGRCGRKLTVPESISSGFGPECIHKI